MTAKPDRIDMTAAELGVMIGDIANRRAPILPIMRKVKEGSIGYCELTPSAARVLRLGPPGSLPMVALVADVRGEGPEGFRLAFLRHLFARATAVLVVADEQPDDLAYEIAAAHCADLRRHVVLVECPQTAIGGWTEFAYSCGLQHNNLAAFINDEDVPEGFDVVDLDDISPASPPAGPVH